MFLDSVAADLFHFTRRFKALCQSLAPAEASLGCVMTTWPRFLMLLGFPSLLPDGRAQFMKSELLCGFFFFFF